MRIWTLEQIKRADMCEVLSRAYGMEFTHQHGAWSALSPFCSEQHASFHVKRAEDGHWLFKDFSAGLGGSLIDFVWRYEKLLDFPSAFRRTRKLLEHGLEGDAGRSCDQSACSPRSPQRVYRLETLYRRFRRRDESGCGAYLRDRGIDASLVRGLLAEGVVVRNVYGGTQWCCFAVRDAKGKLRGLFNRCLEGEEKFLLGERWGFCLEWERLAEAETVYVCEGIIDALSLKSLLGSEQVVVALQGSHLSESMAALLAPAKRLIAAVDSDEAGNRLWEQLRTRFKPGQLERFDLEGCEDPNALLQARRSKVSERKRRLNAEEKVSIAFAPQASREVATTHGLHHSRVCELRQEAQSAAQEHWEKRRPGPRAEAVDWEAKCAALEEQFAEVSLERDLLNMRRDWLELQLSWEREPDHADEKKKGPETRYRSKRRRSSR